MVNFVLVNSPSCPMWIAHRASPSLSLLALRSSYICTVGFKKDISLHWTNCILLVNLIPKAGSCIRDRPDMQWHHFSGETWRHKWRESLQVPRKEELSDWTWSTWTCTWRLFLHLICHNFQLQTWRQRWRGLCPSSQNTWRHLASHLQYLSALCSCFTTMNAKVSRLPGVFN